MQLKTLNGSVIKRSKYRVGKDIGGCIYLHKLYVIDIPGLSAIEIKAVRVLQEHGEYKTPYNCIKWDKKTNDITFFWSSDFEIAHEPTVGKWVKVTPERKLIKGKSDQLWHHKWLWVMDNYNGFDVKEAFKRSEEWLKIKNINFSKISNKDYWYPLLKKHKINF